MIGILLCAGKGSRLGLDVPKAIVEINGQTIIDSQIRTLLGFGASRIVVVTGYKAEMVESAIKAMKFRKPMPDIKICRNEDYERGILTSILAADKEVPDKYTGSVFRMDGDIFIHSWHNLGDMFTRCVNLTLGMNKLEEDHENSPLYEGDRNQIHLTKGKAGRSEWACIDLYRGNTWKVLMSYVKKSVGKKEMFYQCLNKLLKNNNPRKLIIDLVGITEIDIPEDLKLAARREDEQPD